MLQIKQLEGKRKYVVSKIVDDMEVPIQSLSLIAHSVSNGFKVVASLVEEMCEGIEGFEDWFEQLIIGYSQSGKNGSVILESVPVFMEYVEQYVDSKEINFDSFVNLEKKSKTSIVFYPEDIRAIAIVSTALKLYSVFSCSIEQPTGKEIELALEKKDEDLHLYLWKPTTNLHKKIYEAMITPCIERDVSTKIFQLIRSRTYKSSITDRYMWDFIKMMISETPESYVMTVFNFLMKSMLTLLDIKQNPIPFLISTVDDSIRWLMKSIYKDKIIYGEVFGGVEDLFGSSLTKENFYLFCCQDVIGRGAKIGMDLLETNHGLSDQDFEGVLSRFEHVSHLFPASMLVTLPIVSKVLEIPYKFLLTIPPKHAILLGLFIHELAKDHLDKRFPVLNEFLISCPEHKTKIDKDGKEKPAMHYVNTAKSSYKIRHPEFVINDQSTIFGLGSKLLKFEILSLIAGILSASKRGLIVIPTGKSLTKMTYYSLESDVCKFYGQLYSNQLESTFEKMKEKSEEYF